MIIINLITIIINKFHIIHIIKTNYINLINIIISKIETINVKTSLLCNA